MTTRRRWLWAFPAVLLAIATVVAVCEWRGWPFLEGPAERWLSQRLARDVEFNDGLAPPGAGNAGNTSSGSGRRFHVRFIGPLRFETAGLRIANPDWSRQQPMLQARDARLTLRWRDVLALRRGEPLRIESLVADTLHMNLERLPDGRSSWQFGNPNPKADEPGRSGFEGMRFGRLAVREGRVLMDDRPLQLAFDARLSLEESSLPDRRAASASVPPAASAPATRDASASAPRAAPAPAPRAAAASAPRAAQAAAPRAPPAAEPRTAAPAAVAAAPATAPDTPRATGIVGRAEGRYRGHPMTATLRTGPALAGLTADIEAAAVPMRLTLKAGPARLHFDGQVSDLFGSQRFEGRYEITGPSLAAVGDPLGLTLPTTKQFSMLGHIRRDGTHWETVVQSAKVGRSSLAGEFSYDAPRGAKPRLTGRLRGPLLYLDDLGPAIGVEDKPKPAGKPRPPGARVLPDRPFDLPSLSAMNADVSVALDRLDPGGERVQPMSPLRGRVLLDDGVLRIEDILARWAKGQVQGKLMVDGRKPVARWEAHLAGSGLVIEQWLRMERPPGRPPYVTGVLGARIDIAGQGRSTAEFLASADGRALLHWTRGSISHLVVEAAGIDIAQAIGVLVRGDQPLPVTCGAADLTVKDGRVTPQVLLVDTRDSTLWAQGSLSLSDEKLALVARVEPKDFSPLAPRSPLHVDGTLGAPKVSIEKGPLVKRAGAAALLAMLHPLAAILPLMDAGGDDAQAAIGACRSVAERAKKALPPPPRRKTGPLPPPTQDASPAPSASAPRRG
jgi:uncharacterized protein involved in outer membrane biogenesis